MMRGVINLLFTALVLTYTVEDLRNVECNIGCRKEGFTNGFFIQKNNTCQDFNYLKQYYNKKQCACLTIMEYSDVTAQPFTLRMKNSGGGSRSEEPRPVTYSDPLDDEEY